MCQFITCPHPPGCKRHSTWKSKMCEGQTAWQVYYFELRQWFVTKPMAVLLEIKMTLKMHYSSTAVVRKTHMGHLGNLCPLFSFDLGWGAPISQTSETEFIKKQSIACMVSTWIRWFMKRTIEQHQRCHSEVTRRKWIKQLNCVVCNQLNVQRGQKCTNLIGQSKYRKRGNLLGK